MLTSTTVNSLKIEPDRPLIAYWNYHNLILMISQYFSEKKYDILIQFIN